MLATIILAFGLIAVSRSMLKAYEGFERSARVAAASRLLEETMEEALQKPPDTDEFKRSGTFTASGRFEPPDQDYTWTFQTRPSGVGETLYIAELRVGWAAHGRDASVASSAYFEAEPVSP